MGKGFYPRPWAVEPAATWAAPELHTRVFSAFELPTFKPAAEPTPRVSVRQGDQVVRRARVSAKPELVGVAAWWAQVPASLMAKDRRWGENHATCSSTRTNFTAEQMARRHAKDQVAQYVALGYSQAWALWYVQVLTPHYERSSAKRGLTRRDEYALFVSSASGPAVDKLAKKLVPARKRAA